MEKPSLTYLIEGARVTSVEARMDREEEHLKGLRLDLQTPREGNAFDPHWSRSFFHILTDIMSTRNGFFRDTKMKQEDFFIYFGYHVSSEPLSWEKCQEEHIKQTMGFPKRLDAYDRYSDMTGYLWTEVNGDGRDLLRELCQIPIDKFVTLRFEITPK